MTRGNTRQRIQDVALELFAEQGYEKTSLREIAEHLDVTKAALYYHFKTKEDIMRRYQLCLLAAAPLFRFMHENQATVRELSIGLTFKERLLALYEYIQEPEAPMKDRVRAMSSIFTLHAGTFFMQNADEGDPEEKQEAVLEVALDLIDEAHRASYVHSGSADQMPTPWARRKAAGFTAEP
ncbi:TetR/AcrR family transcriptional regulator [Streptomyces misionensis]|uniref:TetR/AcrR family transcriptional regulator n=1 Tax=Streptomyces misionensis TaxID=67331 RepID=UPI0036CC4FA0